MDNRVLLALVTSVALLSSCHPRESAALKEGDRKILANHFGLPPIRDLAAIGADRCWVTSGSGDLLRSEDGGDTWSMVPGRAVGGFAFLCFLEDLHGWALWPYFKGRIEDYEQGSDDLAMETVSRTTDGGATWSILTHLTKGDLDRGGLGDRIVFVDDLHGWLDSGYGVWRTTDGGSNWEWLPYSSNGHPIEQMSRGCQFLSPEIGWRAGPFGRIYRTSDGAISWRAVAMPGGRRQGEPRSGEERYYFRDATHGLMMHPTQGLLHTDDGGRSWYPDARITPGMIVDDICSVRDDVWVTTSTLIAGASSEDQDDEWQRALFHSADGGYVWEQLGLPDQEPYFVGIQFGDAQHGWLVGAEATVAPDGLHEGASDSPKHEDARIQRLYRTTDGGKTWRVVLNRTEAEDGGCPPARERLDKKPDREGLVQVTTH